MRLLLRLLLAAVGCLFAPAALGAAIGKDWWTCVFFSAIAAGCLYKAAAGVGRQKHSSIKRTFGPADTWPDAIDDTLPHDNEPVAFATLSDFDFTSKPISQPRKTRRSTPPHKRPRPIEGDLWLPRGHYEVEVTGESQFQTALVRIIGGSTTQWVDHETMADLVCEPQLPHDFPDTGDVFVHINGARVGQIPDGIAFRRRLIRYGRKGRTTRCHAKIRGGGMRSDGSLRMLGVWLDMPPFRW